MQGQSPQTAMGIQGGGYEENGEQEREELLNGEGGGQAGNRAEAVSKWTLWARIRGVSEVPSVVDSVQIVYGHTTLNARDLV